MADANALAAGERKIEYINYHTQTQQFTLPRQIAGLREARP